MNAFLDLMDWGMTKWRKFSAFDVAVFKMYLFSLGTLFGMNAAKDRKKLTPIFQTILLLTFCRMIWRMFFADRRHH